MIVSIGDFVLNITLICYLPAMGHFSQYHQKPLPRVLRFSSHFHYHFISMNGANPENLSFKTFPYQVLLVFKNVKFP